jgi:hypothetical protein
VRAGYAKEKGGECHRGDHVEKRLMRRKKKFVRKGVLRRRKRR